MLFIGGLKGTSFGIRWNDREVLRAMLPIQQRLNRCTHGGPDIREF